MQALTEEVQEEGHNPEGWGRKRDVWKSSWMEGEQGSGPIGRYPIQEPAFTMAWGQKCQGHNDQAERHMWRDSGRWK